MIAIEDGEIFAVRDLQRFIDVAGLRVPVVRADRPVHADLFAERLELGTAAVIEDIDARSCRADSRSPARRR